MPSSILACLRRRRRHAAHERARRRDPVRRRASAGCRAGRRRGDRGAARRVGVRPARDARLVAAGCAARSSPPRRLVAQGRRQGGVRVEGRCDHLGGAPLALPRRGAVRTARRRRARDRHHDRRALARRHRRRASPRGGRPHRRSTDVLRQRAVGARPSRCASTATTSSASRCSTRPTASAVAGQTSREPERWLRAARDPGQTGYFEGTILRWRAMTPAELRARVQPAARPRHQLRGARRWRRCSGGIPS